MLKKIIIPIVVLLVALVSVITFVRSGASKEVRKIAQKPFVYREYGIAVDSFFIRKGIITPNLFLGKIFDSYRIPYAEVERILQKAKPVFDIRRMRENNKFSVFLSKDTMKKVNYFVYEDSPSSYVIFNFRDSFNVTRKSRDLKTLVRTAAGEIKSNLWFAMEDIGVNPFLANPLSEIFAWTVDFFGLQVGDKFKVIYEEKYVDDKFIEFGNIKAAWFEHMGKEYYAIPFYQDSVDSYFDVDGSSLRRAFLKAPLSFSHVGSGFTSHRFHPILKIVRPHLGVDYSAPMGAPVLSIGDGLVTTAGYVGEAGNMVQIVHNSIYTTAYMHLSGYAKGIHAGVRVRQGQVIGYVGSTGLSTGAHLHFGVWKHGSPVNPLFIDAPPVDPIKPANKEAFNKAKIKWIPQLLSLKSNAIVISK